MHDLLAMSCADPAPIDRFLQRIKSHWTENCGLREATCKRYLPTIRRFLTSRFATGEIVWSRQTRRR
jgi:hypothetical protein